MDLMVHVKYTENLQKPSSGLLYKILYFYGDVHI